MGLLAVPLANAQGPIAQISGFEGRVIVQRSATILEVAQIGLPLMADDRIQTKDGTAEVTFNDGAVMKVRPFTSAMIEEREEKSGWWIFKTKKAVRRMTIYVGKLWFKSGVSKKKNYLQTPTAVCGLRGSGAWLGFNQTLDVSSLIEVVEGAGDFLGLWTQGAFDDPGFDVANVNPNFAALAAAAADLAAATTDAQIAAAQAAVLNAAILAATDVANNNPDPQVQAAAADLINAAQALLNVLSTTGRPLTTSTGTAAGTGTGTRRGTGTGTSTAITTPQPTPDTTTATVTGTGTRTGTGTGTGTGAGAGTGTDTGIDTGTGTPHPSPYFQ